METKEIYRYPYNVRPEDEIKVFLSDVIFEQVVKVTSNNKEIIVSTGIIFAVLFSMPLDARVNGELEFNLLEDSNQQVILARNKTRVS